MRLDGKICVVTGGAMGNGYGIVDVFLKNGATVAILDYSDNMSECLSKLGNANLVAYKVDIRDNLYVNKVIDSIIEKFGKIDILVNNAGVAKLSKILDTSDEVRDFHFDINIKGTWNVTKAVLPYMIDKKYGKIINLSSVTGPLVADSGEVAYATTKAAILGFTKSLAMEVVEDNICVNAIMPGYIQTPMVDGIASDTNSSNPNLVLESLAAGIPMKRLGTITEIGNLALFLGSDDSSFITGQGIVIDGGATLPETRSVGV